MKIGIYSESSRGTSSLGGSEYIVVVLAEWLASHGHEVTIIHHDRALTAHHFAQRFGVDETVLSLRYAEPEQPPRSAIPWRRHAEERRWHSNLSKGYDFFIDVAHEMPPICHARAGFLLVLFPFAAPNQTDKGVAGRSGINSAIWIKARDMYLRWMWRQRLGTYQIKAAISEFSRQWTLRRWGIDPAVFYPPCGAISSASGKENIVLSVGRFTPKGVTKKQPEMIDIFKRMPHESTGWEYVCAGGVSASEDEAAFFQRLLRQADGHSVRLAANLTRTELQALFARSKIFWHATGLREDESRKPEMAEHFGIVTVEAMSAGCVPVVIRKGAQPEIVEHGVSGFLWDTLEELQSYTIQLMNDERLLGEMSANARARAATFSQERFIERFQLLAATVLRR